MALLTVSNPFELASSSYSQIPNVHCREVASISLRLTCSVGRRSFDERRGHVTKASNEGSTGKTATDEEISDVGVRAALSLLKFYKREISPLLPPSCRYVPTCSLYSMEAYKRYGFVKGTVLTAWRLCRCNPLGGHGFDPPRWFGEEKQSDEY